MGGKSKELYISINWTSGNVQCSLHICLLNTYYIPSPILGTGDTKKKIGASQQLTLEMAERPQRGTKPASSQSPAVTHSDSQGPGPTGPALRERAQTSDSGSSQGVLRPPEKRRSKSKTATSRWCEPAVNQPLCSAREHPGQAARRGRRGPPRRRCRLDRGWWRVTRSLVSRGGGSIKQQVLIFPFWSHKWFLLN